MTKEQDEQLRLATWERIKKTAEPLEDIPGVAYVEMEIHYGTGEPNPNLDFNPCVLTVGKMVYGTKGIR